MRKASAALLLLCASVHAAAAFDANEVTLGSPEKLIKARFPNAHCQALQWLSRAADRRCDDSRITVGGIEARITFYLKKDAVEAFDLRFDSRDLGPFTGFLEKRFGKARSENTEKLRKLEWQDNGERAVLTTEQGKRRASLLVWRGNFEEEIYRVR